MVEKQATMTPEFLHEALALAQVVCWEWDLLRNSLQIPDALPALFGFCNAEVLPTREQLLELVHPEDRSRARRCFWPLMESREDTVAEFRVCLPGETRHVRGFSRVKRDSAGQAIRVIGAFQNTSAEKAAQAAARNEAQQRFHVNKVVTMHMLMRGLEHEVNNPNGVILLGAPLMRDSWTDAQPILESHYTAHGDFPLAGLTYAQLRGELPGIAEDVVNAALRIRRLLGDMREYAQTSHEGACQPFEANEAVLSACRALEAREPAFAAVCELDLAQGLPSVCGDLERTSRLVQQVLQNAYEAAPAGSQRVRVSSAAMDELPGVRIVVEDNGAGIPEEDLSHVTDPFFTTKRADGHSGLGLSIADALVRDLGGLMRLEQALPSGTRVILEIPCECREPGSLD